MCKPKKPNIDQSSFLFAELIDQLNPKHPLLQLTDPLSGTLKYLSRYLYRSVISEKNIINDDGSHVTFRYRDSATDTWKTRRVSGEAFLWLVFQHVLPKGFRRVRDYGFLHGNAKKTLRLIQWILKVAIDIPKPIARPSFKCMQCGEPMSIVEFIPPAWRAG